MTSPHQMSLDQVRSKASGWHFAKECLSPGEAEMLAVIEELLIEVDAGTDGRGHKAWPSEEPPPALRRIGWWYDGPRASRAGRERRDAGVQPTSRP